MQGPHIKSIPASAKRSLPSLALTSFPHPAHDDVNICTPFLSALCLNLMG